MHAILRINGKYRTLGWDGLGSMIVVCHIHNYINVITTDSELPITTVLALGGNNWLLLLVHMTEQQCQGCQEFQKSGQNSKKMSFNPKKASPVKCTVALGLDRAIPNRQPKPMPLCQEWPPCANPSLHAWTIAQWRCMSFPNVHDMFSYINIVRSI